MTKEQVWKFLKESLVKSGGDKERAGTGKDYTGIGKTPMTTKEVPTTRGTAAGGVSGEMNGGKSTFPVRESD